MSDIQEQSRLGKLYTLIPDEDVNNVIREIAAIVGDGVSVSKLVETYEQPQYILERLKKYVPVQLLLDLNPMQICYEMDKEFDDTSDIIDNIGNFLNNITDWVIQSRIAEHANDYEIDEEDIVFEKGFTSVDNVQKIEDNLYIIQTDSGSFVAFVNNNKFINQTNDITEMQHNLIVQFVEENKIDCFKTPRPEIQITPGTTILAICPDPSIKYLRTIMNYIPDEYNRVEKFNLPNACKNNNKFCYIFSSSEEDVSTITSAIRLMRDSSIEEYFDQDIVNIIEENNVDIFTM